MTSTPPFDLERYLTGEVEQLVATALKSAFSNLKESKYLLSFVKSCSAAEKRRKAQAAQGLSVPPFLIASITGRCNLHCAGCYARAAQTCSDAPGSPELSAQRWEELFAQAESLGVSFILLAGGEPFLRRDVLESAARHPALFFPIFTNGTLLSASSLSFLDAHRNLLPILSIEGDQDQTDDRRGAGMYQTLVAAMDRLLQKKLYFGASITVTARNFDQVTGEHYPALLSQKGCKALFFIEYVPLEPGTQSLCLTEAQRVLLEERLWRLRQRFPGMVVLSFPGDEDKIGGCLAAGRGFFHINSRGDAEPCPFAPYSDINLSSLPLESALRSRLFEQVRAKAPHLPHPPGGCVLYNQQPLLQQLSQGDLHDA